MWKYYWTWPQWNIMEKYGLDSPGSAQGKMMDCWERATKFSGYIKRGNLLPFTPYYKILCFPHPTGRFGEPVVCKLPVHRYSGNWTRESLTLHTAVVGTVRLLLGSQRKGQKTLHLFQKHLLSWEYECIVSRNKITSVKSYILYGFYNLFLLKILTPLRSFA
jgi:hypothetical protein